MISTGVSVNEKITVSCEEKTVHFPFQKGRKFLRGFFGQVKFEGWTLDGELDGLAIIGSKDFEYHGEFKSNRAHGVGVYKSFKSSSLKRSWPIKYIGEFFNGELTGLGSIRYLGGGSFFGHLINLQFEGLGVLKRHDMRCYIGQFKNNEFHGYGMLKLSEDIYYVGQFCQGQIDGFGAITDGGKFYICAKFKKDCLLEIENHFGNLPDIELELFVQEMLTLRWNVSDFENSFFSPNLKGTDIAENSSAFYNRFFFDKNSSFDFFGDNQMMIDLFKGDLMRLVYPYFEDDLFDNDESTREFNNDDECENGHEVIPEGIYIGEYSNKAFNGVSYQNWHGNIEMGEFQENRLCGYGLDFDDLVICYGLFSQGVLKIGYSEERLLYGYDKKNGYKGYELEERCFQIKLDGCDSVFYFLLKDLERNQCEVGFKTVHQT